MGLNSKDLNRLGPRAQQDVITHGESHKDCFSAAGTGYALMHVRSVTTTERVKCA